VALFREMVAACQQPGCRFVGRGCANGLGGQAQRFAKFFPERDVRSLLVNMTRQLSGVATANLLEPAGHGPHNVTVLLDVVAELIASQGAMGPTLIEAVVEEIPSGHSLVKHLVHYTAPFR